MLNLTNLGLSQSSEKPAKEKKEMMSIRMENQQTVVKINSSSLDLLLTCKKKADFRLLQELEKQEEAEATLFGSAVHKAMEHWYSLPLAQRAFENNSVSKAILERLEGLQELDKELEGSLESVRQFVLKMEPLWTKDSGDKRSVSNGIKILKAYFKHYEKDGLEIYRDEQGPFIERKFEFVIYEDPSLKIIYFGTIDAALVNPLTKSIFIADHKTTAALGTEFFNRLKPNHQYTGYVLGAREAFGIQCSDFMINGIQVAKTKQEFARQFTERTEEDFEELRIAVIEEVKHFLYLRELGRFPMSSATACGQYGGCTYLEICSVPKIIQENVISSRYKK